MYRTPHVQTTSHISSRPDDTCLVLVQDAIRYEVSRKFSRMWFYMKVFLICTQGQRSTTETLYENLRYYSNDLSCHSGIPGLSFCFLIRLWWLSHFEIVLRSRRYFHFDCLSWKNLPPSYPLTRNPKDSFLLDGRTFPFVDPVNKEGPTGTSPISLERFRTVNSDR